MEYVIVGWSEELNDWCLVYPCGSSKERADKALKRILENPTENDLHFMKGLKDFKIKETPKEDCWWNQGSLD